MERGRELEQEQNEQTLTKKQQGMRGTELE
jgi:hypothetical protein